MLRRGSQSSVDLEAALRGDLDDAATAITAAALSSTGVFTATGRLRTTFCAGQPAGPLTLKEKSMWPRADLQRFKHASQIGLHGLGHFWHNLKSKWQRGVDLRTKYSGMGIIESGCDLIQQDFALQCLCEI